MRGDSFMAIDCGNSRLKATLFEGARPIERSTFKSEDIEGILSYMESHKVGKVAMVSVGGMDVRMVETLRQAVDDSFLLLTHHTPLPINICYDTPMTLGLDRVAAAVGARSLYKDKECVVADAGTALTVDRLSADGTLTGGTISPGVSMQFRSLHEGTHLLPEVSVSDYTEWIEAHKEEGSVERWPRSTRSAIACGVITGIVDRLYCSLPEKGVLLLTGGDGEILYKQLIDRVNRDKVTISYHPDLIALGLKYIFDEYEKEI